MNRIFLIPLLCMLVISTMQCQSNPPDTSGADTTENMENLFDEQQLECINQPTSVLGYLLNGWEMDPSPAGFYNFKVIRNYPMPEELNDRFLSNLLVLNESYDLDPTGRSCEFVPNVGLMFLKDSNQTTFLFCFACDIVKVYHNSDPIPKILKMDPIAVILENYFVGIFPDMKDVMVSSFKSPDSLHYHSPSDSTELAINITTENRLELQQENENQSVVQGDQSNPNSHIVHIVEENETLWSISRQHGVEVIEIIRWNELENEVIRPGQRLKIYH